MPYLKGSKAIKVELAQPEDVDMENAEEDDDDDDEKLLKIDESFTDEPENLPAESEPPAPVRSNNKRKLAQTVSKLNHRAKMTKASKTGGESINPLAELSRAAGLVEDE